MSIKINYKITSRFKEESPLRDHLHNGLDFKMETGEPLRAIKEGIIHIRNYGSSNAGKTILIEGEDGRFYIYGHLSEFNVKEGQHVEVGDLIGWAGNSGHSFGSHLHFGIREGNHYLDPSPYIDHIQNMNNLPKLYALTDKQQLLTHKTLTFTDLFQQQSNIFSDLFNNIKFNLINLLSIDYSIFMKHIQYFFQSFS